MPTYSSYNPLGATIGADEIEAGALDSVLTPIFIEIAQHEIEIIEIQANGTITPLNHDTLISDTMLDTTGYENTVQTGTTTATFDTNKYKRSNSPDTDTIGATAANVPNYTPKIGTKFLTKTACKLTTVTAMTGMNATTCYLYNADRSILLDTKSFSAGVATFAYDLADATSYWLLVDSGGSNYTYHRTGSVSMPKVETRVNFTAGIENGTEDTTYFRAIETIVTELAGNKIVDISLGTITGTVLSTQLVCNCPDRETGDAVTYKLKNATQSDDALALDTKNDLVNLTTVPTGIEIQLTPKSVSPTDGKPSIKTFCLKIWKA